MSAFSSHPAKLSRIATKLMLILPIVICASLAWTPVSALANGTITGKITAADTREGMIGANVYLKGTTIGAVSKEDGSFTITDVPPGTYTLVASFVGYRTESSKITMVSSEAVTANFVMKVDVFLGEEIVVTGIASRTSKEVAEVAVSRVAAAQLTNNNNYQSVSQLVTGKMAGVSLAPSSGNAASGFRFNIRSGGGLNGDEQPIIYVDGVRLDNSEFGGPLTDGFGVGGQGMSLLASLNPEDVEKMEVLKGPAAAASYGTGGANGVVLITTKRGKLTSGQPGGVAIDYKYVTGWNEQASKYSTADYITAAAANRIFRDGNIGQHTLNATGGLNTLKYFVSFDRRGEEGITRNNELNRTSLRANLDVVPNTHLNFQVNAGYTLSDIQRPNNDNNILGYLGNTLLRARPYTFTDSIAVENIGDKTNSNRFVGSVAAEYSPIRNLYGRLSVGVDNENLRQDQTFPLNYRYPNAQADQGQRAIFDRSNLQYTYSFDARYSFNPMSNLTTNVVAGAQLFNRRLNTNFTQKFNFPTELLSNIGAGAQFGANNNETFRHSREAGIFTEANVAYADQYYFTLGIRRDYASVVGKEAPSINYPKGSLAVRLDRYDFFPSMFDLMKVRAAYGETGVLPDLLDGIPLLWRAAAGGYGRGAVLGTIGNAEIEPERVKELELGFEAGFLTNYSVEFTYYRQDIENSIVDFINSPSTGKTASAAPFNIGKAKGSGVEMLIQANPLRTRNYGLDLSLIWNYQTNEVQDLGGAQPIFDPFDLNVIKEGFPKHEFYTPKIVGPRFNATTGVYEGSIVTAERYRFGNPIPKYNGSFTVNFRFLKNFNFYALTDWATEFQVFNSTLQFAYNFGNNPEFNTLATQLGVNGIAGIAPNSAAVPGVTKLTPGTPEYQAAAEKFAQIDYTRDAPFIEDGDFIKLREISLTYSLKDWLPKISADRYLKDVVLGFSARNVLTSTKYSGPDVEVNFRGSRDLTRGQDFLTLQSPKTYNFIFRFSL